MDNAVLGDERSVSDDACNAATGGISPILGGISTEPYRDSELIFALLARCPLCAIMVVSLRILTVMYFVCFRTCLPMLSHLSHALITAGKTSATP